MLSASASNALLKTLEEPPDHVVFVLATTDPQKVLPTIRSRTQHYEFHLLDSEVLARLLTDVVREAKLELPDSAVESAVRRGRGSARDALSALDQVVASGVVNDDTALIRELVAALAERDTARALKAVQDRTRYWPRCPTDRCRAARRVRGQFLEAVAPGLLREGEPPAPHEGPSARSRRRAGFPARARSQCPRHGGTGNSVGGDARRHRRPDHARSCHRSPHPPGSRR